MKNESHYFIQIDKNRIVRCESISFVRYDKDEKCYKIRIDGGDFKFDKEDAKKICNAVGIRL